MDVTSRQRDMSMRVANRIYITWFLCNGHAAAYSIESPSGRYDSAASASKVERFEQDYLYGIKLASWTIMIPLFGEMNYSGMEADFGNYLYEIVQHYLAERVHEAWAQD